MGLLDSSVDMVGIKQYGKKHEQKMWQEMRTGVDVLKPMLPIILALVVILLILGPFFMKKVDEVNMG